MITSSNCKGTQVPGRLPLAFGLLLLTKKKEVQVHGPQSSHLSHASSQTDAGPFKDNPRPMDPFGWHLGAAQRQSLPATGPPEMYHKEISSAAQNAQTLGTSSSSP